MTARVNHQMSLHAFNQEFTQRVNAGRRRPARFFAHPFHAPDAAATMRYPPNAFSPRAEYLPAAETHRRGHRPPDT
jgi:hypothetical protein